MKKVIFPLMIIGALACSKESNFTENSPNIFKKDGEVDDDRIELPSDFNCEYVVETPPAPVWDLLDMPEDLAMEQIDKYRYCIARAVAKFSCESSNFENSYKTYAFSRFGTNVDTEVEVVEWADNEPALEAHLVAEFNSRGFNWSSAKHQFSYKGDSYVPLVYLENGAVVDWGLHPYVGIGTDLDVGDSIGDFIPFFQQTQCEAIDPYEFMITKVDSQSVASLPDPPSFDINCIYNLLLIVQIGDEKHKKDMTIITTADFPEYSGTDKDTVIPGVPPPGPGCQYGMDYSFVRGHLGGKRNDRSKHSEFEIKYVSIPLPGSTKGVNNWKDQGTHLKRVHKRDKSKLFYFNHYLESDCSNPGSSNRFSFGPSAGIPDEVAYLVTYEYDWYATPKRMNFPNVNGGSGLFWIWSSHKRDVYQIMVISPADWCEGRLKEFTKEEGAGYILAL